MIPIERAAREARPSGYGNDRRGFGLRSARGKWSEVVEWGMGALGSRSAAMRAKPRMEASGDCRPI